MNNVQVHYDVPEETSQVSFLPYLPSIILQRKWLVIIPTLLGLIAGLAAAFLLPVKYQSRAVLLVEASLLPEEIALDPSGAEVVDQRMARIRQQVLSRPELIELIQRNNLYDTELRTSSLSDVLDTMRGAIVISPVTADVQTTGSGRKSTIAFGLSFTYSDPSKTQGVVQAMTEQVLQLDSSKTAAQATNTVEFLTDQSGDLQNQIKEVETALVQIKMQNGLALTPATGLGGNIASLDARISGLQASNSQLAAQRDITSTAAIRDPVVNQAEQALADAQARYSDAHPDVVLAKQRLAEAQQLAKHNQTKIPLNAVDAQLASNNKQLAQLQALRDKEMNRNSAIANAQVTAPAVTQQVAQLESRLSGLNGQYQRVSNQLMSAKAGKKAEDEQQGERLSLVDAAAVPDQPVSPNRPMIISLATAAGLGLGLAVILLIEIVMKPIRDASTVVAATGEAPLVVIPTIMAKGEKGARKGWKALWPFGGGKDDDDDDEDDEPAKKARKK